MLTTCVNFLIYYVSNTTSALIQTQADGSKDVLKILNFHSEEKLPWEAKTSESVENLRRTSFDHNFLTFLSVEDHFIAGKAKNLSITKLCLSFFLFLF